MLAASALTEAPARQKICDPIVIVGAGSPEESPLTVTLVWAAARCAVSLHVVRVGSVLTVASVFGGVPCHLELGQRPRSEVPLTTASGLAASV